MSAKILRQYQQISPTVSTSAYAAGDAISGLLSMPAAFRSADQSGILRQLNITAELGAGFDVDVLFFASAVTGGTDNDAYTPAFTEAQELVGLISFVAADFTIVGANAFASKAVELDMQLPRSTTLYFQLVARGAVTFAATDDLSVGLVLRQD